MLIFGSGSRVKSVARFSRLTLFALWVLCFVLPDLSLGQVATLEAGPEIDVTKDGRYNSVVWVQQAAEYRILARQTYRLATLQMVTGLDDRLWSADEVQLENDRYWMKPPAVILDLDETVLDNSSYNARNIADGQPYDLESWNAWCLEAKGLPIPGAKEFLSKANALGVKVFFVTNRRDEVKQATIQNLNALDLGVPASADNVLTRNDDQGRAGDKLSRRAMVAKDFRIVLLIGDNLSDLCDGVEIQDLEARNEVAAKKEALLGSRWIVMPNPVYGSWERSIPAQTKGLRLDR